MIRRLAAIGSLLLALPAIHAARPNVLLILVDDLKPVLGAYGDERANTPHMDRLARSGLVFTAAYTNQAVCAPARNALLAGLRPSTVGVYNLVTNFRLGAPDAVTMPQRFAQAGYRVETLGKVYHRGNGNEADRAALSVPHWDQPDARNESAEFSGRPAWTRDDVPDETYSDGAMAAEAVRRLQAAAGRPGQPFFFIVGFKKPHLPFVAPEKYWALHDRTEFAPAGPAAPPVGAPKLAATSWGELRNYSDVPKTGPLDDAQARQLVRGYYAATSYTDAQIGRVLDELERLQLDRNTIVVLWGDHGFHLGDHGFWCKHTNYEQANRIPLLVRAPGVTTAGSRSAALIESVDLFPTLCDLTGLEPATPVDGVSQVSVLRDPARAVRSEVFHVYPRGELVGRALRDARYRLVEWKQPGADPATAILELYDYTTDPQETRNVAAEQPEVVARLRARLATLPEARPQIQGENPPVRPGGRKKQP